ncbi:hypothetical protein F503_05247 [Ophiostoma piceae UAMH 11346]|uniref:Transmembrane protein 42 n=1 Tax=Ophiostoma piceae (strain UAMH 11346) TaxID=1262450 RepID=S3CB65_OPHP1|nr:hypothetical protein F503_05247 [Ophiostoma piceae UAMH 11346]
MTKMLRQRRQPDSAPPSPSAESPSPAATASTSPSKGAKDVMELEPTSEQQPLFEEDAPPGPPTTGEATAHFTWLGRNQWVGLALASGACAAFNGVFAKLTTTELTTRLSEAVARLVGLDAAEGYVEIVVRGTFFALNLVFNGIMWTLFTRALARGHSATQVSIMNTSANFVLTALMGFAIFSEALPPLWWLGAAMLVAGNVIIGRKDEAAPAEAAEAATEAAVPEAVPLTAAYTAAGSDSSETDSPTASSGRRTSRRLAAQRGSKADASSSASASYTSTPRKPAGDKSDKSDSD